MTSLLDSAPVWIDWTGMETDLIFNAGYDLPHFASFPMMDDTAGRDLLDGYAKQLLALKDAAACGVILETPTWMASAERAAPLGYTPADLDRVNREAVEMMVAYRTGPDVVVSGNIGPRGDAYSAEVQAPDSFAAYHAAQIETLAQTQADILSAFTIPTVGEAIGLLKASRGCDKPMVISFVVETDGRLPDGTLLTEAIAQTDDATDHQAAWFAVNCAHPEHIWRGLPEAPTARLKGVIANASRCSHAELDEAEHLDDGDPAELAQQMAAFRKSLPDLKVIGGCCGTDLRHLREMANAA